MTAGELCTFEGCQETATREQCVGMLAPGQVLGVPGSDDPEGDFVTLKRCRWHDGVDDPDWDAVES